MAKALEPQRGMKPSRKFCFFAIVANMVALFGMWIDDSEVKIAAAFVLWGVFLGASSILKELGR